MIWGRNITKLKLDITSKARLDTLYNNVIFCCSIAFINYCFFLRVFYLSLLIPKRNPIKVVLKFVNDNVFSVKIVIAKKMKMTA